jgi:hypothetical protein
MTRVLRALAVTVVMVAASATMLGPGQAVAAGDTAPPTTPAGLHVVEASFTWVHLAWAPATDNSGPVNNSGSVNYEASIDGPGGRLTQTGPETNRAFGGLEAGQTYTASVRAFDRAGNTSATVSIPFTTLPRTGPPPTVPGNLRGEYVDGVLKGIAWDASVFAGTVTYELFSGSTSIWATSDTSVTIFELIHIACAVEPGGTYTLTVRAIGEHNYPSGLSTSLTVTVP